METRIKMQDDKFNIFRGDIESLKNTLKDTDKHINLYLPFTILNMITDALH